MSPFWPWPKGTLNYHWFSFEDFKCITGVEATVYPIKECEEELKITGNEWALHLRNRYSATYYDVKMLNDTLRGARQQFGGIIQGDYGKNRYALLWEDNSTPISRGISGTYEHVIDRMSSVKHSLKISMINDMGVDDKKLDDKKMQEFIEYSHSHDPNRVIYNALVPFAIAMFEHFFSTTFQILIKYDSYALEKRKDYKLKIHFSTLLDVNDKKLTIEEIIAKEYSFQNLNHVNKAYKEWLDIDVKNILYKKRKIKNSVIHLEKKIYEIIQYRHEIIHKFQLDTSLTKEKYINILEAIEKVIQEFVMFLEKKYNIEILEVID